MSEPLRGTCSPWAGLDDICQPCSDYEFSVGLLDKMLQVASDLLFDLTARQFPGLCSDTVRPCSQPSFTDTLPRGAHRPLQSSCGCDSPRLCGCARLSEISLGVYPLVSVEEVRIDGAVLDPSAYRVDDYRYLVRIDGDHFPCCQNLRLADTELDTFSVSFTYGASPPSTGVHAAAVLACELALACTPAAPGDCRLPPKVQSISRQGISMVLMNPADLLVNGRTGIAEIDLFLSAVNPRNRRMPSAVFSPDVRSRVRRVDTGGI